jgi:hypothetical protein
VSSDPLCPEDSVHSGWPFSFFSIAYLHNCILV